MMMAFSSTSFVMGCLGMVIPLVVSTPRVCPPERLEQTFHENPADCSAFYVCQEGRLRSDTCGEDVWSQELGLCVVKNSESDTCTKRAKRLEHPSHRADICANIRNAVFAKADNCAQYYDCGSQVGTVTADPHVMECPYPQLFSANTLQCQHYSEVTCGDRPQPKDACEYVANQCRRAHCVPCFIRFPACKRMPDGYNHWVGKKHSPYYVFCQNGHVLFFGLCNDNKIFHPETRLCIKKQQL